MSLRGDASMCRYQVSDAVLLSLRELLAKIDKGSAGLC